MTSSPATQQDASESSPMWPVDYVLNSAYSPLRVEEQQPKRQWRDAFEDLLALESYGEMISMESRKKEKAMGLKIRYAKTSWAIIEINMRFQSFAREQKRLLEVREKLRLKGNTSALPEVDQGISDTESMMQKGFNLSKRLVRAVEAESHYPASQLKPGGQWIASLVSSGALPGWSSATRLCHETKEQRVFMLKTRDPRIDFNEKIIIAFTENELGRRFGASGVPTTSKIPSGNVSQTGRPHGDEAKTSERRYVGSASLKTVLGIIFQSQQHLITQVTTSERIPLPDGSTANKVILTNYFSNGKEERVEIVQDAAKVLDEVEKALSLMEGHKVCW